MSKLIDVCWIWGEDGNYCVSLMEEGQQTTSWALAEKGFFCYGVFLSLICSVRKLLLSN